MFNATFDPETWARVPFHFWSVVFFVFGCIVGSFLNVCIHRMPLAESIVSPPSHCPHCKYSIPWFLNVPLVTWLYLRGKCKNCGAPISIRYFLVELLTGTMFLACWLTHGRHSAVLALIYCGLVAGLIVATFTDFEHTLIPDEITFGGMAVGLVCSTLYPPLQGESAWIGGLKQAALGIGIGGGAIYLMLRVGKLLFGRQRFSFPAGTRMIFTDTALHLPDSDIPYEEIFYRKTDVVVMEAQSVELPDRCYKASIVRLNLLGRTLEIGDEKIDPEQVQHMEVVGSEIVLPREAMGLGDAKFMAAIGGFLGWQAVIFCFAASAMIGTAVMLPLIALGQRERSSRIPYGPYIAMAAVVWIFLPETFRNYWMENLRVFTQLLRGAPPDTGIH